MRRLVWSEDALADFEGAITYIARDSRQAALSVLRRIDETAEMLAATPIGRPGRVKDTYEKVVRGTPYIIAFAVSENALTVLRVIHARRGWPDGAWPEEG